VLLGVRTEEGELQCGCLHTVMHLGYSYSEFAMPYSLSIVVPVL